MRLERGGSKGGKRCGVKRGGEVWGGSGDGEKRCRIDDLGKGGGEKGGASA